MQNIRLYIENEEVELDESISIAITRTFEDLSKPTTIINDWSKTVKIPSTNHNDKMFGNIYKIDYIKSPRPTSSNSTLGIDFDPSKRLQFRLTYIDSTVMSGYAKMLNIHRTASERYYEISLNGELGRIFQDIKDITFDKSAYGEDRYIDTKEYYEEKIDKNLIHSSWNNEGNKNPNLIKKSDIYNYNKNDIIGFAPNNSYSEDFDYNSAELRVSEDSWLEQDEKDKLLGFNVIKSFSDLIGYQRSNNLKDNRPIDTILDKGFTPYEYGEYRSYHQIPYIYFNKLFQMFETKVEELTGYKTIKDDVWFNKYNPYWDKYVMTLKNPQLKDANEIINNYYGVRFGAGIYGNYYNYYWSGLPSEKDRTKIQTLPIYIPESTSESFKALKTEEQYGTGFDDGILVSYFDTRDLDNFKQRLVPVMRGFTIDLEETLQMLNPFAPVPEQTYDFNNENALLVTFKFIKYDDEDAWTPYPRNNELFTTSFAICATNPSKEVIDTLQSEAFVQNKGVFNIITIQDGVKFILQEGGGPQQYVIKANIPVPDPIISGSIPIDTPFYIICELSALFNKSYALLNSALALDVKDNIDLYSTQSYLELRASDTISSGSKITLSDLWDNSYSLFDIILQYCKMHRIYIYADDFKKTLNFVSYATFFNQNIIEDWTNKIDLSSEMNIKPVVPESKYLLFNYEKDNRQLNELYNKDYDLNFGEIKIETDYNFNTNSQKLFDKAKASMEYSPSLLTFNTASYAENLYYTIAGDSLLASADKDGKTTNMFGQFYFYNGTKEFDLGKIIKDDMYELDIPYISDDSPYQTTSDTFTYYDKKQKIQNLNLVKSPKYSNLSLVWTNPVDGTKYLSIFNTPKSNYTSDAFKYDDAVSLYNFLWEKYISERYSISNKIISCNIRLSPKDFNEFSFNKFILLDDRLFLVNKISDFDITTFETSTKVEFISIDDPNNYKNMYENTIQHYDILSPTEYSETFNEGASPTVEKWIDINVSELFYLDIDNLLNVEFTSSAAYTWEFLGIRDKEGVEQRYNDHTIQVGIRLTYNLPLVRATSNEFIFNFNEGKVVTPFTINFVPWEPPKPAPFLRIYPKIVNTTDEDGSGQVTIEVDKEATDITAWYTIEKTDSSSFGTFSVDSIELSSEEYEDMNEWVLNYSYRNLAAGTIVRVRIQDGRGRTQIFTLTIDPLFYIEPEYKSVEDQEGWNGGTDYVLIHIDKHAKDLNFNVTTNLYLPEMDSEFIVEEFYLEDELEYENIYRCSYYWYHLNETSTAKITFTDDRGLTREFNFEVLPRE